MAVPDYDPNTILVEAAKLPPSEAVAFFRKKGFKITWDWRETLKSSQAQTFTVAKAYTKDILQDIRNEVDHAIANGVTLDKFRERLEPKLKARGWWGAHSINGKQITLGTPWRLKTIFSTNTQSAYNAGRMDGQIENKNNRPYWMLIEVLDGSTRHTHAQRSGSIARWDSSFWKSPNSWYPPNGYNCRGRVRALTEAQAKSRGIGTKGSGNPDKGFGRPPNRILKLDDRKIDPDIKKIGDSIKEIRFG